jgi:hypothetical protein
LKIWHYTSGFRDVRGHLVKPLSSGNIILNKKISVLI